MMIDDVDVKIVKKLQSGDWKGTIAELAEGLTISEEAVQKRIQRLEKAEIILYYDISLTPWIYGGEWIWAEVFITLQNPLFKHNVIEELKAKLEYYESAMTGTVIPSGSNPDISITFHARAEKEYQQEVRKFDGMKGIAKINVMILEQMTVPKFGLDYIDWKVLRSLKQDLKKISKDLSKETGVTHEELERRLNRLIDEKKLFFFAATDFSKIDNWAHIHVKVTFQKELSQISMAELNAAGITPPHNDWRRIHQGILTIEPCSFKELIDKTNKILRNGMKIQSLSLEDRYLPSQPWLDKLLNSKSTNPKTT